SRGFAVQRHKRSPGEARAMTSSRKHRPGRFLLVALAALAGTFRPPGPARAAGEPATAPAWAHSLSIESGKSARHSLGSSESCRTYRLLVSLGGAPVAPGHRVRVELAGPGSDRFTKDLHPGAPDFYLPYRPSSPGDARLTLARADGEKTSPIAVRV